MFASSVLSRRRVFGLCAALACSCAARSPIPRPTTSSQPARTASAEPAPIAIAHTTPRRLPAGSSAVLQRGLQRDVVATAFDPTGAFVAAIAADRVQIWEVATGLIRGSLSRVGGGDSSVPIEWSPDGRWIAVPREADLTFWDLSNDTATSMPCTDRPSFSRVAWHTGSHTAAAVCGEHVQVWDLSTHSVRWSATSVNDDEPFAFHEAHIDPSGRRVFVPVANHQLAILDATNGAPTATIGGGPEFIRDADWSTDGTLVAIGQGNVVNIVDAASGRTRASYRGSSQPIRAVAFSPDGAEVAISGFVHGGTGLAIWLWRTGREDVVPYVAPGSGPLWWSPDSSRFAFGDDNIVVLQRSGRRWSAIGSVGCVGGCGTSHSALTFDMRHGASHGEDSLLLWDVGNDRPTRTIARDPDRGAVRIAASGNALAVITARDTRLYDLARGETVHVPYAIGDLSPDGRRVVRTETTANGQTQVVDPWSGRVLASAATNAVRAAQFTPDGRHLWDLGDETGVLSLATVDPLAHVRDVPGAADLRVQNFSPDGAFVVLPNGLLVDIARGTTRRLTTVLEGDGPPAVTWFPDGHRVVVGHTVYDVRNPSDAGRPFDVAFVEVSERSPFRPDGVTALGGPAARGAMVGELNLDSLDVAHEITELPNATTDGHNVFAWSGDGARVLHYSDLGDLAVWDRSGIRRVATVSMRGVGSRNETVITRFFWARGSGCIGYFDGALQVVRVRDGAWLTAYDTSPSDDDGLVVVTSDGAYEASPSAVTALRVRTGADVLHAPMREAEPTPRGASGLISSFLATCDAP